MCFRKMKNWSRRKKTTVILLIVFTLIVLLISSFYWLYTNNYLSISDNQIKFGRASAGAKLEEQMACPADGVWTTADKANRHPLAVAIENHPDSRPQSGLDKASLIYETPTEGGITRFLAVYVENDVQVLGPVRSARTYFLDWLSEFDGIFAHCGGNADALALIRPYNIKDLDEFSYASAYWRSRDRYAPHNLYTSTDNLWQAAPKEGWDKKVDYASWKYKEDPIESKRPKSGEINIDYANSVFQVNYTYNPKDNNYLRSIVGKPHIDKETGVQLAPKNVVVMWVETWPLNDRENGWYIETTGSGRAKVFMDGQAILGTWKKDSQIARTKFYDEKGAEISFNRGQTWIEVVPDDTEVTP
jgi:hypothetical protein